MGVAADGDGMPDLWEQGLKIDSGIKADANTDADEDGATNLEEYLCATSPVDPEDCPLLCIEQGGTNLVVLTWPGRPGRTYRLVTADSLTELLGASATVLSVTPAASNGPMRFENPLGAGEKTRFYQLIISPPR